MIFTKSRIKNLRKALNLTQQAFANRLKVSRNTIAKYETGDNAPSAAVISLICKEFNVSEEWLQNGTGEMFVQHSESDAYRRAADILGSGEHEMDRIVRGVITKYGDMDKTSKDVFLNYLKTLASSVLESEIPTEAELQEKYIIEDQEDAI